MSGTGGPGPVEGDEPGSPRGPLAAVRREWLEQVLDTTQAVGSSADLTDALDLVATAVSEVLGFGAVAVNVVLADDNVRVEAVAGAAAGSDAGLLGVTAPLEPWRRLLARGEPFGPAFFYGHDRDQTVFDALPTLVPEGPASAEPGAWHPEDMLFVPLLGPDGALVGTMSVDLPSDGRFPDEEQRTVLELFAVQAAAAIVEANRRDHLGDLGRLYREVHAGTPAPTIILDARLEVSSVNGAAARLLGVPVDDLVGRPVDVVADPVDRSAVRDVCERVLAGGTETASIEHRLDRSDRPVAWAQLGIARIHSPFVGARLVLNLEEVTEARRTIDQLRYLTDHDALTGLANRMAAYDHLGDLLEDPDHRGPVAVLACGLDRIGAVATGQGQVVADEVVVRAARRLEGALRPGDRLCRTGEHRFDVLLPLESGSVGQAEAVGQRCVEALRPPFELRSGVHHLGLSVGVAEVGVADRDLDPASLLAAAATALELARDQGGNRWVVVPAVEEPPG